MRVLFISSVLPVPSGGGQLLLHRHLLNQPDLTLGLVLTEPWPGPEAAFVASPNPFWRRLRATRFTQEVEHLQDALGTTVTMAPLLRFAETFRPDLILTVAHGALSAYARRVAQRLHRPLATIFHDWWPDLAPQVWLRNPDAEFRQLYAASRVAFCVSEPLRRELGPHSNSVLLLPIPGTSPAATNATASSGKFRVVYTGSLNAVYRAGMETLCRRVQHHPRLQLELWGDAGEWPASLREPLRAGGIYRGVARGDDPAYLASLGAADALLTHLSFASADARRVRTSFPSKLVDYTRWGKPLVLWGPTYSSADEYLRPKDAALLVDSPDPDKLVHALVALADDAPRRQSLADRAAALYRGELAPSHLQNVFRAGLQRAIAS